MVKAEKDSGEDLNEKKQSIQNSLMIYIRGLLKLWWLFLIIGIIAGIAGIFYAAAQKPIYKSSLTFALDDEGGNSGSIGNILNLASQFGLNMGGSKDIFAGDNILEIMKSRRMLERVLLSVDTFNNKPFTLIEYFLLITERRKSNMKIQDIHFPAGRPKSTFSYQQDSLLYTTGLEFANNFLVAQRPDRKLNIFEVSVSSPNEKFTKVFTDRIVDETNKFYVEIRTKKAKETLDVLEDRVATMKDNLNSSISNKAAMQDAVRRAGSRFKTTNQYPGIRSCLW